MLATLLSVTELCCHVGNRNLFLEMLPLVGSHDSIMLVRDLVMTRTINNDTSIQLLSSIPFSVRHPSEQLLTDLEVVAHKLRTYLTIISFHC